MKTQIPRQKCPQELVEELIANDGELRTGPINTMGVWRLADDLNNCRKEKAELAEALRYLLNTDNVAISHAKWGEGCNREEVDAMLKQARAALRNANPVVEGSTNPSDFRKVKP